MEGVIGMIKLILGQEAPDTWAFCEGQPLSKVDYPELDAMLGGRFGSNDAEFYLPLLPSPEVGRYVVKLSRNESESEYKGLISQICLYLGTELPNGWMFCDGRVLSAAQYPVLARTMGSNYGGDGTTTVGLPNMFAGEGLHYIICVEGVDPTGGKGDGAEDDDDF